jgi:hypothetical protein
MLGNNATNIKQFNMGDLHCYTPLSTGHETRVLQLLPGKQSDPIQAQLHHIDLDDSPTYEALSYEWGDPQKEQRVQFDDGSYIGVTTTLFHALQDLRHDTMPRTIWADAICINQDDIKERQQQVSLMGIIYSKAARVVTYIGPEKDNSSAALDLMEDLVKTYHQSKYNYSNASLYLDELIHYRLPPQGDSLYAAIKAVIMRGWSNRCWCAQEFLLNKSLNIMCGRRIVRWDFLTEFVELCWSRCLPVSLVPHAAEDPQDRARCLSKLVEMRHISPKGTFFAKLLPALHPTQTTDPRDKIYALFGLACDVDDIGIKVDYGCSPEELYINAAIHCLESAGSLELLYSNLTKKTLPLPSWVPDWSTWEPHSEATSFDYEYAASGSTKAEFEVLPGTKLRVTGCLFDRIVFQTSPIGPFFTHVGASGQREWLNQQFDFVEQLEPYPTSEDVLDVLRRTLTGDLTFGEKPAGDLFNDHFRRLCKNSDQSDPYICRKWVDAVRQRSRYRSLCSTERGYLGAVPYTAKEGDWICMFHGMKLLFVVREIGPDFTYVGHAYVDEHMHGEIFDLDWYEKRTITLV